MHRKLVLFFILITTIFIAGCSSGRGDLHFTANGEEFIAEGFTSKEGWDLSFDSVLVNLSEIEAYNPTDSGLSAKLEGTYLVDLKDSFGLDPTVSVESLKEVPAGNYQSLRFSLKQIESGDHAGYSIILFGNAGKEGTTIPFTIRISEELTFDGKEGYVGDSIKGLLNENETADVEMTFHFDHLFGDAGSGPEEHVNAQSPGFAMFLDYEKEGRIDVSQEDLMNHRNFNLFIGAVETLGHLGEGHCEVIR